MEFEEKMEAENDKEGVELNNKRNKLKSDEVVPRRMTFLDNPPLYTPPLPFPHRFQKTKLDKKFAKFLNMFKKLEINIMFVDSLAPMPNYVVSLSLASLAILHLARHFVILGQA